MHSVSPNQDLYMNHETYLAKVGEGICGNNMGPSPKGWKTQMQTPNVATKF